MGNDLKCPKTVKLLDGTLALRVCMETSERTLLLITNILKVMSSKSNLFIETLFNKLNEFMIYDISSDFKFCMKRKLQ